MRRGFLWNIWSRGVPKVFGGLVFEGGQDDGIQDIFWESEVSFARKIFVLEEKMQFLQPTRS